MVDKAHGWTPGSTVYKFPRLSTTDDGELLVMPISRARYMILTDRKGIWMDQSGIKTRRRQGECG
jgi:hypothetical protein